jgi:hypothetical protein
MVHDILYEGMLTLSGICVISIIVSKLYRKAFGKFLYIDVEKIVRYVDPASVAGALSGIIFLMISVYVSFSASATETLINSPLFMNKTLMTISVMGLWTIFLIIRAKYGREVWDYGFLSVVYVLTGLVGFFFVFVTGSIRGHLEGKGSILDPIYDLLGINPVQFWAIGTIGVYTLISVGIFAGLVFTYIRWKLKALRPLTNN